MDIRMLPSFLLISRSQDPYWHKRLEDTLAPLGHLQVVLEETAIQSILEQDFQIVFVDAGAVDDFALLIFRIRAQHPDMRIIVVSVSPTWELAREAFRSGAIDCIRKSPQMTDLLLAVKNALSKPVPPWPR